MKKLVNPYIGKPGYNCIGCAPSNPIGLHLEFWEEGEEIISEWSPSANYQGWVDTLHGGIISLLMDEVAGWVISRKLQTAGMTTSLQVKFMKPVYTTEPKITIRAQITQQRRNFINIHISLQNSQGEVCDEGEAIYFAFSKEKAAEMGFNGCFTEEEQPRG